MHFPLLLKFGVRRIFDFQNEEIVTFSCRKDSIKYDFNKNVGK